MAEFTPCFRFGFPASCKITPFFIAFAVGASLLRRTRKRHLKTAFPHFFMPLILPFIGFVMVFASLGMTTTALSKAIFKALGPANDFGGVAIALVGPILFWRHKPQKNRGCKFCNQGRNRSLFWYGVGLCLQTVRHADVDKDILALFCRTDFFCGWSFTFFLCARFFLSSSRSMPQLFRGWQAKPPAWSSVIKKGCAVLLLMISFLILSGNMTHYKSFLVGGFVSHDMSGHSGRRQREKRNENGSLTRRYEMKNSARKTGFFIVALAFLATTPAFSQDEATGLKVGPHEGDDHAGV